MDSRMRAAIAAGDVVRNRWPVSMQGHVNLFLGSGRMGSCFDAFGMMGSWTEDGAQTQGIAKTVIMHADHWHRGAFGLDYWLPVARLLWGRQLPPPKSWSQSLELADGLLKTGLGWDGLEVSIKAFYHPYRRDILAMELRYSVVKEGAMPPIELRPVTSLISHYNQKLDGISEPMKTGAQSLWASRLKVGTSDSVCALRVISQLGKASIEEIKGGSAKVSFEGSQGCHLLLIGAASFERREELFAELNGIVSPEGYAAEAVQGWHKRYGDAYIQTPVPEYQALWARSLFYVLASYAPDMRSPAPPMGWSGSCWPFHFPQDLSFIHPALLRLGHYDIAKAWVEFYHSYIDDTRRITKQIYKADGALWGWEHPIGYGTKMLLDGSPNVYQYELHNAVYPARMAYETALHLGDADWTRKIAWPVVRESALFFSSASKKDADGLWSIHVVPSMGQDEMGGADAKNYLCALFGARYALTVALKLAGQLGIEDDETRRWSAILSDGLAFEHLVDPKTGLLVTNENVEPEKLWGEEKHPIQLNPLAFLPCGGIDRHAKLAYERRRELCSGVKDSFYHGWTLGAYWLAASHVGDAKGLEEELAATLPGRYVDPDWIQIYESSGNPGAPFYVTTHGFYLQALNDAFLCDFFGDVEIGKACPSSWTEASFAKLRAAGGRRISGERKDGVWSYQAD